MKKNFKNGMKALTIIIMLAFIAPVITNAQAGKANFSGNWAFNAEKSQMGQGGGGRGFGGGNMVVKQEGNLLTVETTRQGRDGATRTTTMKYTLDGKESINTSQMGDSKSVATWNPDGKSLKIATTRNVNFNGESRTMNSTEVWTLASDNSLSVARTTTMQNGDVNTTMVYDKK